MQTLPKVKLNLHHNRAILVEKATPYCSYTGGANDVSYIGSRGLEFPELLGPQGAWWTETYSSFVRSMVKMGTWYVDISIAILLSRDYE